MGSQAQQELRGAALQVWLGCRRREREYHTHAYRIRHDLDEFRRWLRYLKHLKHLKAKFQSMVHDIIIIAAVLSLVVVFVAFTGAITNSNIATADVVTTDHNRLTIREQTC